MGDQHPHTSHQKKKKDYSPPPFFLSFFLSFFLLYQIIKPTTAHPIISLTRMHACFQFKRKYFLGGCFCLIFLIFGRLWGTEEIDTHLTLPTLLMAVERKNESMKRRGKGGKGDRWVSEWAVELRARGAYSLELTAPSLFGWGTVVLVRYI